MNEQKSGNKVNYAVGGLVLITLMYLTYHIVRWIRK